MFTHQYNFDIKIPDEVITKEKHENIRPSLFENKIIIGLCGYSKSGKDTIAESFTNNYGFHRVAFSDNLKKEMNKHLKTEVWVDLTIKANKKAETVDINDYYNLDNLSAPILEDGRVLMGGMIDFLTEDIQIKKVLRPYIIWYGEKLREINGPYYWINKAFSEDVDGHDKIIITDLRREKELEIFKWSNNFHKKSMESWVKYGISNMMPDLSKEMNSYSTLLFHVNQFMLTDNDVLTHECIRIAQENWMFDHTFYVDPRIRKNDIDKVTKQMVNEVANKFGINKPDKTISEHQTKLF